MLSSYLPARFRTAARSAATRTATRHLRTRFVDREAAASELIVVQLTDSLRRIRIREDVPSQYRGQE
jgi:hypothetical protein